MEFKIIKRNEIKLVGIEERIALPGNKLQELWTEFMKRKDEIKNSILGSYYGVASEMEYSEKGPVFNEMVAVEVSEIEDIPEGMSEKILPSKEYLVFTHRGRLLADDGSSLVKKSYETIYGDIIPKSEYRIAGSYNFEFYDSRFIFDNPASEFDIYIPVERKLTIIKS